MSVLVIKTGDSFAIKGTWWDCNGVPVNLTGYTVACEFREIVPDGEAAQLVGSFTVTVDTGTAGTYVLAADADVTSTWRPGLYRSDIAFIQPNGKPIMSPTFYVRVIPGITQVSS